MKTFKRNTLVRNDSSKSFYSKFICNLMPSGCRVDSLEGKEYLVVPMVILTEGVHAGSMGPLYYPEEELSKTPAVWNHKPIVVYHPTFNGEGITACDPTILNSRKVGLMMNTRYDKGKLKSEAWLDRARADVVDNRIMEAVDSKEMMELSTGVFIDVEQTEGKWKKEEYKGVARNFRPDHLALLPDQKGACSIADGAGLLRNAKYAPKKKKAKKMPMPATGMPAYNEMSFSDISCALSDALSDRLNPGDAPGYYCYIQDIYPDYFIYCCGNGEELYSLSYTMDENGTITLSSDAPVEVERQTSYVETTDNQNMNKKKLIAMLMANAIVSIGEVKLTDNMTDDQVKSVPDDKLEEALKGLIKKPAKEEAVEPAANSGRPNKGENKAEYMARAKVLGLNVAACEVMWAEVNAQPAANADEKKIVSLEDYIASAPKQVQDVLNNSLSVYNEEKVKLIEAIVANKNNGFSKEDLQNRPLGELRNLSRLAGVSSTTATATNAPNYGGQAPTANAANNGAEEVLEIPVINFAVAK